MPGINSKEVNMKSSRKCPICSDDKHEVLFHNRVDSFDDSTFNVDIKIVRCGKCSFVYNDIDSTNIERFYQNESLYSGESGFGIGGSTPADLNRYKQYIDILDWISITKEAAIVDVGCAKGGFLLFLKQHGFSHLNGVEIDHKCVEYARRHYELNVSTGTVNCLPRDNGSMDLLIYNHVLEHLYDPLLALAEAKRVLKDDGILFVEVPNAGRYEDGRIFDFYWFCMREHINHFDLAHLTMLMESAGFERIYELQSLMPYNSTAHYPSLCALFRNTNAVATEHKANRSELCNSIRRYVETEEDSLKIRRDQMATLASCGRPVYVWGIGLEFFSLYSLSDLRNCNLRYLVDKNPAKQGKTIGGVQITSLECLDAASSDAVVVITSVFNKVDMLNHIKSFHFSGDVITFD
jgi:2-polyprenyl-3-methyl-5-hydroxy-6-metoxy-1,4-benzoquinol methylase